MKTAETNYGQPDGTEDEGFNYTFKHVPTGLMFTAYSARGGPAYGDMSEDKGKLMPIIERFKKLLESTVPTDCEIEYNTSFALRV